MNEITLPPSPNWYLSTIIACAGDGTVAWGARNSIIVAKKKENAKGLDYTIIDKAHLERVASIAFSPLDEENSCYYLASVSENNVVNVWNMASCSIKNKYNNLDTGSKIAAVDWSKHDPHLISYVTLDGLLGTININNNNAQKFPINSSGKVNTTCLACCPHDSSLIAVGAKSGLVYIVNSRGHVKYKLRGHDMEITSLSWCPVPDNIFDNSDNKDFLLASGAKDKSIYFWKAGSNGRSQLNFSLPNTPLDISKHRSKMNFTALCWLTPKTLVSNSQYGELLLWDLSGCQKKKFTPTLIHGQHSNGLFAIAGLADQLTEKILEDLEQENWRAKTTIKSIWTLSQDRQVVCCSLTEGKISIEHVIPTLGGFVYCVAACPIDTSLIAFGVGDSMIRLWNLSEPHDNMVEVQILWEKIKGKVRSLSWHPEKENILAFGTDEGRIGLFDTNTKKPPQLAKQFFKQTIYTLGWGPVLKAEEYGLYAVAEGELVYFDPKSLNSDPTVVIDKNCAEFSWKSDYSLLAIGFNNGSISIFDRTLTKKYVIHDLNKPVQCLIWHPNSTMSDLNTSSMQNYLAVAVNDVTITVFEILNTENSEEETSEEPQTFYKTVATLNGHTDKVVGLAWSPHMSGYLVSCSYDYSARVWKVDTQEMIVTYTSQQLPIHCCMWSPLSQDLIITGSADFTLRIWSISNQTALPASELKPKNTKGKRTKKKKTKVVKATLVLVDSNNAEEVEVTSEVTNGEKNPSEDSREHVGQELGADQSEDGSVLKAKKKKPKMKTLFPGYAEISTNKKLWFASVRSLMHSVENDEKCNGTTKESCINGTNGVQEEDKEAESNIEVSPLLGTKKDLEDALNHEKQLLHTNKNHQSIIEIDQWTGGNLKDSLLEAMKNSKLTDFSVSLAASVSKEFYEQICDAYSSQLVFEENPQKAASYLLCINKVREAIDVLHAANFYRQAYIIAASRLDSKDPVIVNILTRWANYAQKVGNWQSAVECYIKLGDYTTAAKLLEGRKDLDSLVLAVDVAKLIKDQDKLIISLADKAVMQALLDSDIATAKSIIKENPQIQYREVEVDVFGELNQILDNISDDSILKWMAGSSNISLLRTFNSRFDKCPKKYSLLLQKDVIPLSVSKKMILINVSHQFALAALSDKQNQSLQHIVRAFAFITQHENSNSNSDVEKEGEQENEKHLPLIKYLYALDNKHVTDPNNIFNSDKSDITVSLCAYLCQALIEWFNTSQLINNQNPECMGLIVEAVKKYIKDLFDKESVKFWTTANEIRKLESKLSSEMSKMKSNNEEEIDETEVLIERLDQLRNAKNRFLDNRVSSPNPMFSYGAVNEFVGKLSTEVREEVSKLVLDTWLKAIS
ncbi:gem-associated protein 5 isoform X2 [Copidosoma floridanum]|nr:gem-associated protein 5 isoform X2 [Copidosoma floridanum]XP_014204868.1 gem-associated protein 5 isoform X2 [Copidosoma floridanum]